MSIFNSSQIGTSTLGGGQFLSQLQYEIIPPTPGYSEGLRRSEYGFGPNSRIWGRSYFFEIPTNPSKPGFPGISFSSVSGALIGKIRTDIERPIISSLEFTVDENGSNEFTLELLEEPGFEILPMSIVKINIGNSENNWFCGVIQYPENTGTKRKSLQYSGFGLRFYLETLRADVDYAIGLDLTEIVDDIVQNWIAPYSPISYNSSKIDVNSGVVLINAIELGKFSIKEVLDTLSMMSHTANSYYIWGVDGNGDFYWTKKNKSDIEKTFFIGYNLNDFQPFINYNEIKNVINILRTEGRGSGGVGWAVAGVYNDASSVKKYGRKELNYQVPGFFGQEEADLLGNALRDENSEPKFGSRANKIIVSTESDFLSPGNYRFIMPLKKFQESLNDLDDSTEFAKFGSGDLAISDDSSIYMFANGGIKFTCTTANNDYAVLDVYKIGRIDKIVFYVRSDTTGSFLTVGIGSSIWNQYTTKIDIGVKDLFIPVEWDVSSLAISEILKFGIRVDQDFPSEVNFWIDKLDVIINGHKTYTMKLKNSVYKFNSKSNIVNCEFGQIPASLPQYLAGLQSASSELRFTGEIR